MICLPFLDLAMFLKALANLTLNFLGMSFLTAMVSLGIHLVK